MYKFILCLVLIIFSNSLFGQFYVLDSLTNNPIDAVNILYGANKGLVSNDDGYFELPKEGRIDTLYLSHISYIPKQILFGDLIKNDTVFLKKSSIQLGEVVLSNINAKKTVLAAIDKIEDNYIRVPHNLSGFFRQSLQEDSIGVEMVEVDYIGYRSKRKIGTKIINARRTDNYSAFGLDVVGGVLSLIEGGDFVRNRAYFLDLKNIDNYSFEYEGEIEHNEIEIFKISFTSNESHNIEVYRKGMIYIGSESLAILEIHYWYDQEKWKNVTGDVDWSSTNKKPGYLLKAVNNTIKYRQLSNKKWVLAYAEANNILEGRYKNENHKYILTAKIVINNIEINNPKPVKTNYDTSRSFGEAIKKFDHLKGWNDTYKLSLSKEEQRILNDIIKKKNDS